jgi:hypothetical protein
MAGALLGSATAVNRPPLLFCVDAAIDGDDDHHAKTARLAQTANVRRCR